ncbi:MAG: trypsin-like peptidase domain-containing protein [Planctomycetota bacterium]
MFAPLAPCRSGSTPHRTGQFIPLAPLAAVAFACAALCAPLVAESVSPDLKTAAKKILADHQESVVTVKFVSKEQQVMEGRSFGDSDQKIVTPGTVLDASGLTVVSLFLTDPFAEFDNLNLPAGDGNQVQVQQKMIITSVKIVLADGREVPAEVVLRDTDLDLLFVRPKKPGQKFAFLQLDTDCHPGVLDDLIVLCRMGTSVERSVGVFVAQVNAVVKKPRTMYVATSNVGGGQGGLGLPAFDAQGHAVGIGVMKSAPNRDPGIFGGHDMTPVVLPSEDVLDVVHQAEQIKYDDDDSAPNALAAPATPATPPHADAQPAPPAPSAPSAPSAPALRNAVVPRAATPPAQPAPQTQPIPTPDR